MDLEINKYPAEDWKELEYILTDRQKPAILVCSFDTLTGKERAIADFKTKFPKYTQHEI